MSKTAEQIHQSEGKETKRSLTEQEFDTLLLAAFIAQQERLNDNADASVRSE